MARRVVVLVDMDCFYVQVEKKLDPSLNGHPCAVVQYKKWKGGSIIAVDYEARKYGVSRRNNGDEARKLCPHIKLPRIPEKRGKADLTNYRAASAEVIKVLSRFSSCIERASIDEAYIDISDAVSERIGQLGTTKVLPSMLPSTHVAGCSLEETASVKADTEVPQNYGVSSVRGQLDKDDDSSSLSEPSVIDDDWNGDFEGEVNDQDALQAMDTTPECGPATREELLSVWLDREGSAAELVLTTGAIIANEIRDAVLNETGFTCSAGIAHNKVLAKLAAGMNKPNQQTILPTSLVPTVFDRTPFGKVRHLGGKLGEEVQQLLNIHNVGQLRGFSKEILQKHFGEKCGSWLHLICRGVDNEPIKARLLSQSIGCGKNFNGPEKLISVQQVMYWLEQLTEEIFERLKIDQDENSRLAEMLVVHFHPEESQSALSRSCALPSARSSSASMAKSLWTAMMRGHPGDSSVDPAGRTPLAWTTGITGLSVTATKFRPLAKTSTGTLDLFITSPRDPPEEALPLVEHALLGEVGEDSVVGRARQEWGQSAVSSEPDIVEAKRHKRDITAKPSSLETVSRSPQTDIRKYFSSRHSNDDCGDSGGDEVTSNPDVCQACTVCGQLVPIWRLQEHTDYHLAVHLHQEEGFPPLEGRSSPGHNTEPSRTQKHLPGQKRGRSGANPLNRFLIAKK